MRKVREAIEAHPDWDALTAYHARIDADSRIISIHRIPRESHRMVRWGVVHVCQQTCFFKRSLYERVGGINQSLHCVLDTEMWYRMFASGAKWGHIPDFLAGFRTHEAAKGSSWLRVYAAEERIVDQMHPEFRLSWRRSLGLPYYRMTQILSGRHIRGLLQSRHNRGKKWSEVFPEAANVPQEIAA